MAKRVGKIKKKNNITDAVIDVTAGGVGLGVGSLTLASVGAASGRSQVARIAATGQSGLGILSAALPVRAAGALLKEIKKIGK